MNIKELRELIKLVAEKQFAEFELEQSDFKLRIKRNSPPVIQYSESPASAPTATAAVAPAATMSTTSSLQPAAVSAAPEPGEQLHQVTSPIVGTFYRAPSPTSEPYVKIGDHVEPGTILCIIEAMKLMNEIASDVSGEIARVYVENGQPVEFGQSLFGIKLSS